jgi:hypothetical protein
MIPEVPVLGDPERTVEAFDTGALRVVEADDLMRLEMKLGAIDTEVHG